MPPVSQTTALPLTLKLDQTVPTISAAATPAANAAGWHHGDVTIGFSCADALSGITTCPASQTLSATGSSTSQVATDAAGNTSAPSNVIAVKIDKTPPQVALNGGPAHGSDFYFGEVPAAPSCSGSDGVSGLASCIVSGYGTGVGTHTVIATATDVAGNVSVASATYTVLAWTFAGFYHPVDMDGVVNTVKGGADGSAQVRGLRRSDRTGGHGGGQAAAHRHAVCLRQRRDERHRTAGHR